MEILQVSQDLHIHTCFSYGDSHVVPEQTLELISKVRHSKIIGISDHLDYVYGDNFNKYSCAVRSFGFHLGVEVDGAKWVDIALLHDLDYYVYHCYDTPQNYSGLEKLIAKGKPVIVAHPLAWKTDLSKVSDKAYVEISNRYDWKTDWKEGFTPYLNKFKFVLSSDAHQPLMLNQNVARYIANELGVQETIVFH